MTIVRSWLELDLWQQILIAMTLGIVVGGIWGPDAQIFRPLGTIFLNAIKMLIVPLVFASLVTGVTSMNDTTKLGRVGFKTVSIYLVTTAIAISIGLFFGWLLQPGAGMNLVVTQANEVKEAPGLLHTLIAMIPTNPVTSMTKGAILQIIVFALILGVSLNMVGEKAKPVIAFFEGIAEAMYKMTSIVMMIAPYGVFGLMAWVAGKYGAETLVHLGMVLIAAYIASLLHMFGFYGAIIAFFCKLNPLRYFKKIKEAQLIAYSTSSSAGTLPVTMRCAENVGASKGISSFVLPLGATINMDGTALYQGVAALFVAQAYGIHLTGSDIGMIIATSTLASIGTAGVPGAGLIMLTLVLSTVGLPMEGIALVAGIDRLLDMMRTTVNISGDLMVTTIVARSENEFDEAQFLSDTPAKT